MEYMGHTAEYWLELQKRADTLGATNFLGEIAHLRGVVSYYESRIKEMSAFMQLTSQK